MDLGIIYLWRPPAGSTQRGRTSDTVDGDRVFVMSSSRPLPPLSGGSAAVTNGQAPDGHHSWKIRRRLLSVHGDTVRLILKTGIDP